MIFNQPKLKPLLISYLKAQAKGTEWQAPPISLLRVEFNGTICIANDGFNSVVLVGWPT